MLPVTTYGKKTRYHHSVSCLEDSPNLEARRAPMLASNGREKAHDKGLLLPSGWGLRPSTVPASHIPIRTFPGERISACSALL